MRSYIKSLGLLFVSAMGVGLAEQRARGVYEQYSSRPGRVTGNAIKRKRTSRLYNGKDGARAMERRRRQFAAGMLRFHSHGISRS